MYLPDHKINIEVGDELILEPYLSWGYLYGTIKEIHPCLIGELRSQPTYSPGKCGSCRNRTEILLKFGERDYLVCLCHDRPSIRTTAAIINKFGEV